MKRICLSVWTEQIQTSLSIFSQLQYRSLRKAFYTVQPGKEVHVEEITSVSKGKWDIQQVQEIPKKQDGSIDYEALKLNHDKMDKALKSNCQKRRQSSFLPPSGRTF